MAEYLLRVEAVNLDGFLFDSQDISTVRGGGLILLDRVEKVAGYDPSIRVVYTGASIGVYLFEADDGDSAEAIRKKVEAKLHEEEGGYATFQVVVVPAGDRHFQELSAEALTRVRVSQLQSPSVVLPELSAAAEFCEVDDIRPAVREMWRQGGIANDRSKPKMRISAATWDRRNYGIDRKHDFYAKRVFFSAQAEVVNDLGQLTDCKARGLLHGKMALIYLDGNKFGSYIRACDRAEEAQRFAEFVKHNQNAFLHHVLEVKEERETELTDWTWSGAVTTNAGVPGYKKNAFRIEVLLWGGDEILLIVPAWCGWWTLAEFYRVFGTLAWPPKGKGASRDATGREWAGSGGKATLSHSGAIVFSHYNAPIQRLRDLAKKLAESVKPANGDFFTYQVLESFDHLGADPRATRLRRLPPVLNGCEGALTLPGSKMHEVEQRLDQFRKRFPKSQLHRWIQELCESPEPSESVMQSLLVEYSVKREFERLMDCLTTGGAGSAKQRAAATWLHIAELWDYVKEQEWERGVYATQG